MVKRLAFRNHANYTLQVSKHQEQHSKNTSFNERNGKSMENRERKERVKSPLETAYEDYDYDYYPEFITKNREKTNISKVPLLFSSD
jgi:hypothetical protein